MERVRQKGYILLTSQEMGGADPEEMIGLYNDQTQHAIYIVAPQAEFNHSTKWMVHEKNEVLSNEYDQVPDLLFKTLQKRGMGDVASHMGTFFLPAREEMIHTAYFKDKLQALAYVEETYGLNLIQLLGGND